MIIWKRSVNLWYIDWDCQGSWEWSIRQTIRVWKHRRTYIIHWSDKEKSQIGKQIHEGRHSIANDGNQSG
jgi:hypothetical protein